MFLYVTVLRPLGTVRASCFLRDREPSAVTGQQSRNLTAQGPSPRDLSKVSKAGLEMADGANRESRCWVHGNGIGLRSSQEHKLVSQIQ